MGEYSFKCRECEKEFNKDIKYEEIEKVKCECGSKVSRIYKPIMDIWKTGGNFGKSNKSE